MNQATRALVWERAGRRCEHGRLHQDDSPLAPTLHLEHIVPKQHGGLDDAEWKRPRKTTQTRARRGRMGLDEGFAP